MKTAVAVWLLVLAPVASADPAINRAVHAYAGVSVVGFLPRGDEFRDVYSLGLGAGAEVGLAVRNSLRLAVSVAPSYSSGDPVAGPLAAGASAKLWAVPLSASVQIVLTKWPKVRPYVGVGLTAFYVNEKLSFSGPLGARQAARSWTPLGVHGQIGFEQNRPRRFFGELWFLRAEARGIDGGGLAREIGGLQIRLGYRARL